MAPPVECFVHLAGPVPKSCRSLDCYDTTCTNTTCKNTTCEDISCSIRQEKLLLFDLSIDERTEESAISRWTFRYWRSPGANPSGRYCKEKGWCATRSTHDGQNVTDSVTDSVTPTDQTEVSFTRYFTTVHGILSNRP